MEKDAVQGLGWLFQWQSSSRSKNSSGDSTTSHYPYQQIDGWQAQVRALGVSNFGPRQMQEHFLGVEMTPRWS